MVCFICVLVRAVARVPPEINVGIKAAGPGKQAFHGRTGRGRCLRADPVSMCIDNGFVHGAPGFICSKGSKKRPWTLSTASDFNYDVRLSRAVDTPVPGKIVAKIGPDSGQCHAFSPENR